MEQEIKTNLCKSCNLTYNYYKNNMCIMCNIIDNPNNLDIQSFVIGKSNLSQFDIVTKTREFIYKNNKIPLPIDIDKNVCVLHINSCIFLQVIKTIQNQKNKDLFADFKVFFTDELNIKQIKVFRIFDKVLKNKTSISYNYNFTNIEKDIYNKYYEIYVNKNKNNVLNLFNN